VQSVKAYWQWWLNNKTLLLFSAIWAVVMVVKISHYSPLIGNNNANALFFLWTMAPFLIFGGLAITHAHKPSGLFVFSINWWIKAAVVVLPILLILDIYNTANNFQSYGTFLSFGWMFVVALIVAKRNQHLGGMQSLLLGAIIAFGFMFAWEIMYRMMIYWKAGFSSPTWGSDITVSFIMVLPAILVLAIYRPVFSRMTLILSVVFLALVLYWALSGMWTWVIYKNGVWTTENWNFAIYELTRVSKIIMGLAVASLVFYERKLSVVR
jgi:hypothetical protein